MNRSRNAAVLMLVGAFAAGGGTLYAGSRILEARRDRQPECPQPRQQRSERDLRERFFDYLGLDSAQRVAIVALLNTRDSTVRELFAVPRAQSESVLAAAAAKSDSLLAEPRAKATAMRDSTREKQNALYTPPQRAKLDAQRAAMKERDAERDARRAMCQAQSKNSPQAKSPATKTKSNNH